MQRSGDRCVKPASASFADALSATSDGPHAVPGESADSIRISTAAHHRVLAARRTWSSPRTSSPPTAPRGAVSQRRSVFTQSAWGAAATGLA